MRSDEDAKIAAEIRGSQIHVMESNVWKSLIGYLMAAGLVTVFTYREWSAVLNIWGPIVLVVCSARTVLALRTALGPTQPSEIGAERMLMIVTGFVSATMAFGPTWIALQSHGLVSAIMITLIVSSMWGGALVQASLFSSAASYTAMNVPVWLLCLGIVGIDRNRLSLTLLFFVTVIVAIDNVRRYAKNFEHGLRQQIHLAEQSTRLKQQADVIGLLLKEHEDQSSDWLWHVDTLGRIRTPSPRFTEALSGTGDALEGRSLRELFTARGVEGNQEAVTTLLDHIDDGRSFRDLVVPGAIEGMPRWWLVSGRPTTDDNGRISGYRGVMADITEAKQAQAQVIHLAHHDVLTGLANRAYFRQRLDGLLAANQRRLGLLSIDLDGFKPINDRYGHPVGDALLIAIAAMVAAKGIVARLGGDEFAVETVITGQAAMEVFCSQLLKRLHEPYRVANHDVSVGASIGVAFAPTDGRTTEELFKNADAALYRAKRDGRGTYRFFAPEMDQQLQERMLLQQELREALGKNQFVLHYQPFVDVNTRIVTGCEALIRWRHPTRGQIPPADFIPLAEDAGLIVQIGAWVIETACAQAAAWPHDKRVSVNISPAQFNDRELLHRIHEALRKSGLAPTRLEIEVTEAVLIEDADAALDVLRRVRAMGVKIALDDFGTGYSSLSYLRKFPFDKVKIDRSFVTEIESRHDSQVIVQGIHDIALGLGMTITAEGVETHGQAQQLQRAGCHELQGFLFSRPQPVSHISDCSTRI